LSRSDFVGRLAAISHFQASCRNRIAFEAAY
jgi:hypothetical protein